MILSSNFPKISCLMVTANGRLNLAKKSIKCFIDQTYPNKELLIINEGSANYQKDLQVYVDNLNSNIKTIWLNGKYTLGSLRNISIKMSEGEYFVQWDDDDFCTPQRIFAQYSFLTRNKAKVCYLTDQLHYFWDTNTLYWNNWKNKCSGGGLKKYSLIPGTGMFHRDIDVRYLSYGAKASAGEDTVFANDILNKYNKDVVLLENMGWMHCYTYHGNQVYDLEHHSHISSKRSSNLDFIIKSKEKIIDSLNYFKFAKSIKVMSYEGLAFVYEGLDHV